MPQIFVFTAGNPEAREHLADSIQNPIDDPQAKVFENFDEAHHAELERIRDEAGEATTGPTGPERERQPGLFGEEGEL
jgi:hypothetical protein